MESNEQTELTSKTERLTDRQQAESSEGEWLGVEGSSKKEKGLMDMDNSVEIAGGGGERWINGNGKNTIFFFKSDS